MAVRKTTPKPDDAPTPRRGRPATTPEGREHQLVVLAYDLVEDRIRNGTATSQEVTHFLKLGSTREMIEQERIRTEVQLNHAKIETMAQANRIEELMGEALDAMRKYKGERIHAADEPEGY